MPDSCWSRSASSSRCPTSAAPSTRATSSSRLTPLKPVTPGARVALGAAFFVLFFAAWAAATFGGYVSPTFLADPASMLREGWNLLAHHGFLKDIGLTLWRVVGGFVIAAAFGAPQIAEILRLVLGWAWTYVIVAELIGASAGIVHMIMDSQALLNTGQIIFGILVIGFIGLISDFLFKALNRRLFPWSLA